MPQINRIPDPSAAAALAWNDAARGIPQKLQVMKMLTSILEAIPLDGNGNNFTGRVYRGKTQVGSEAPPPAMSLLESQRPDPQPEGAGKNNMRMQAIWNVLLQGWVPDDPKNPLDPAYRLMAAAELALSSIGTVDQTRGLPLVASQYLLGGLINAIQIGPGVARPPEVNVSANAFFYIPLVITLALDTTNPYVQAS